MSSLHIMSTVSTIKDLMPEISPLLSKRGQKSQMAMQFKTALFLRLFSLIIAGLVVVPNDGVWEVFLKLRIIRQIIVSPKICHNQIVYVTMSIDEYLEQRQTLFPEQKLRPQHHFLSHCLESILAFGPLVRVWTLLFEVEHSNFKRCCERFQNLKSVSKCCPISTN